MLTDAGVFLEQLMRRVLRNVVTAGRRWSSSAVVCFVLMAGVQWPLEWCSGPRRRVEDDYREVRDAANLISVP